MKPVKSLFILLESGITSFPIDDIVFIKLTNKFIDIRFTDNKEVRYNLRLTKILNCIFELTNYSQFFFGVEGILFNPLHSEIIMNGQLNQMTCEIIAKTNTEDIVFISHAKEILTQLAKSNLIVQSATYL
jgi:hypothetical protein